MKACSDCIHAVPFSYPHNLAILNALARCALTPIILNIITHTGQHRFCTQQRASGECGPEGKRFEAILEPGVICESNSVRLMRGEPVKPGPSGSLILNNKTTAAA